MRAMFLAEYRAARAYWKRVDRLALGEAVRAVFPGKLASVALSVGTFVLSVAITLAWLGWQETRTLVISTLITIAAMLVLFGLVAAYKLAVIPARWDQENEIAKRTGPPILVTTPTFSIRTRDIQINVKIVNRSKTDRVVMAFALCFIYDNERRSQYWHHSPELIGLADSLDPQTHTEGIVRFRLSGPENPNEPKHETYLAIRDAISGSQLLHLVHVDLSALPFVRVGLPEQRKV